MKLLFPNFFCPCVILFSCVFLYKWSLECNKLWFPDFFCSFVILFCLAFFPSHLCNAIQWNSRSHVFFAPPLFSSAALSFTSSLCDAIKLSFPDFLCPSVTLFYCAFLHELSLQCNKFFVPRLLLPLCWEQV